MKKSLNGEKMKHTCNWCAKQYKDGYDNQYCSERCKRMYDGEYSWVEEYDMKKSSIDNYLNKIMKE